MLNECHKCELKFELTESQNLPYAVVDPTIEIENDMSAILTATFRGPDNSKVIGRAWISDMDGTIVDGETEEIPAGTQNSIELIIPKKKIQNGPLIACMRVEWPLYQTKHVIKFILKDEEIVHPPKGKQC